MGQTRLEERRDFIRKTLQTGLLATLGSYGYGSLLERRLITSKRLTVRLPGVGPGLSGFKIAHLSDLHLHPYTDAATIAKAVAVTNALAPDVVLLSGDFITHRGSDAEELAELLTGLRSPQGTFACMGNHDCWYQPWFVRQHFTAAGIGVLENRGTEITHQGESLWIGGLDSAWAGRPELMGALPVKKDLPTVLLVHEPDYADIVASVRRPLLQLSGHSHGGQVRVPFAGAVVTVPWAKKYIRGLYQVGEVTLHVSPGIGCTSHGVRFACPPEVTLITLA
jgi:uncharacterized protein